MRRLSEQLLMREAHWLCSFVVGLPILRYLCKI